MNNESPKESPTNVDPASDHVVVSERLCCGKCQTKYGLKQQCNAAHTRTIGGMGDESNCSFCGEPRGGSWIKVVPVETPDYRNNGQYQFVRGIGHFGAEECAHVSREEIERQCRENAGDGVLVDDGHRLCWVPSC